MFAANDPRQNFLPIVRGSGPAVVLGPFTFFHGVPVAFVTAAEALFLFCDPIGIRVDARLGDHGKRGIFALAAGINAEARRYRLRSSFRRHLRKIRWMTWPKRRCSIHSPR